MTVGVSHTFGGTVVVVDMADGRRWDMTPEQAEAGAKQLDHILAKPGIVHGLAIMDALDNRQFRFAGAPEDIAAMAADLRKNADAARAIVTANDNGGTAA